LYVVGGAIRSNVPSDKLFIYDPVIDEWKEGEPMPTARRALTANFIDGILYTIGGEGHFHKTLNVNEAYDPVSNTWTEKEPMPTARHHLTSAVVDGKLYVIGGRQTNEKPHVVVDTVEMYDPITNTWTEKEPMPTKRSAMTAVAVIDDIYVLGGAIEECPPSKGAQPNRVFNNNEKYNTVSNTWKAEPPMPTARHGPLSALIDGEKIYAIGGGPQPCFSLSNMTEIFLLAN
jgi:N-acetylneuraminic acid mutarotase